MEKKKLNWTGWIYIVCTVFVVIEGATVIIVGRISNGFLLREDTPLFDAVSKITSINYFVALPCLLLSLIAIIYNVVKKNWRNLLITLICCAVIYQTTGIINSSFEKMRANPMRWEENYRDLTHPKVKALFSPP